MAYLSKNILFVNPSGRTVKIFFKCACSNNLKTIFNSIKNQLSSAKYRLFTLWLVGAHSIDRGRIIAAKASGFRRAGRTVHQASRVLNRVAVGIHLAVPSISNCNWRREKKKIKNSMLHIVFVHAK